MSKIAVAQDVRQWYADNPNEIPEGAEKSVALSCKGRIKPVAIAHFNKKSGMKYQEGNTKVVPLTFKHPSTGRTRKAEVPLTQVRALAGDLAGKRGYLSEAALAKAAERYALSMA